MSYNSSFDIRALANIATHHDKWLEHFGVSNVQRKRMLLDVFGAEDCFRDHSVSSGGLKKQASASVGTASSIRTGI